MQWLIILIALIAAIPTYGVSIVILIILMPMLSERTRKKMMPQIIERAINANQVLIEDNVYYEAAEKYARDTDNVVYANYNNINFNDIIKGKKVNVTFSRSSKGTLLVEASLL